jgi:hypothetical protein
VKQIGDIESSLSLADLAQFTAHLHHNPKDYCREDSTMLLQRLLSTDSPPAVTLIRLIVGSSLSLRRHTEVSFSR